MSTATGITAPPRHRHVRRRTGQIVRHLLLICGALVSLFPFYWMIVLATSRSATIFRNPPQLIPGDRLLVNVRHIFEAINIWAALANTTLVAVTTTFLVLLTSSLAAFAFAKFDFPGRKFLFGIILATFLLPAELSTIPQFLIMVKLNWVGQLKAVIVPAATSAFGIFWMRSYMTGSVHTELLEAATLDGCGFFRQYLHVALPVSRPALAFLGMFTFIGAWNSFMWPLIVLTDPSRLTLQVALSQLSTAHGNDYGMLMASGLISVLPLIVVFVLGSRQFLSGITEGAIG